MRILFVTPYVPSPIRVRPFQLIKALSARHEVSLVAAQCDGYEAELARAVEPYCASLELVPLPRWQAYANCVRALPGRMPLRVAYYQSQPLVAAIERVRAAHAIEVIHGEHIKVAPALRATQARGATPVVFDAVDCISAYLAQQRTTARTPAQRAFVATELAKMRVYEGDTLGAFARVAITSARDQAALVALGLDARRIQVVANGVDTEHFRPPCAPRRHDRLVFCAKLDYFPNAQAIVYFCREVLPLIWAERPCVQLVIAGSNPPRQVRALAADERIRVTGYVPDVRPYLGGATVALAPLLVATGMQNKVLEALAMGAPLVATPGACGTLPVRAGEHLLIAEGARAYADAVLALLGNPARARRIGRAGRAYVEREHSWMLAARQLDELYQASLEAARPHERVAAGVPEDVRTPQMVGVASMEGA